MSDSLALAERVKQAATVQLTEPPAYKGSLYGYQKKGVAWLYAVRKGILADSCGTGKTHHAMALAAMLKARGELDPGLVLVPAAAILQWADEFRKFTSLHVGVAVGSKKVRTRVYAGRYDVVLVSYETMVHDWKILVERAHRVVICDEATVFRNPGTKTAQFVKQITRSAETVILMSATPIQTNLMDFHSIFEALHLKDLGSRTWFKNRYCVLERQKKWVGRTRPIINEKIVGYKNVAELKERLAPRYLRRTFDDVEGELPDLVVEDIWLDLLPEQRAKLEEIRTGIMENGLGEGIQVKNSMHALQKCVDGTYALGDGLGDHSSKLDKILELVTGDLSDQKVVVFSFYKRTLAALARRLNEAGVAWVAFTGDQSKEERREAQLRFTNDPACRVAMGTTALEMSLNLQAARYLITVDLLWNPARVEQLVGRIRRSGSAHSSVAMLRLLVNGYEDRILDILRKRQAIADVVFDEQSDIFEALTREEMMELIRL